MFVNLYSTGIAAELASILIIAGTVLALPAMVTGLMEMIKIEEESPAYKIVTMHMNIILISWMFYAVSLFVRMSTFAGSFSQWVGVGTSLMGFVCLCVAGWYGGRLVYEYGVGRQT